MNINNLNYQPPMTYNEPNKEQENKTMTRAEAIEYIQEWLKDEYALNGKDRVVLNMAIKSLEQEPICCKDCKHWHEWENGTGACRRSSIIWEGTDYDDYCSFAERKEE